MKISPSLIRKTAVITNAVLSKAVFVFLGYLGGDWLDNKYDTSPLFMMGGMVLGLAAGLWYLMRMITKCMRD